VYEGLDGSMIEEELYFRLSSAEIMELESNLDGPTLTEEITALMASEDTKTMMAKFKWFVQMSYVERSEDGKKLKPKDETTQKDFVESLAFDALLGELMGDPEGTGAFLLGMFPQEILKGAETSAARTPVDVQLPKADGPVKSLLVPAPFQDPRDAASGLVKPYDNKGELLPWWNREPTDDELQNKMTKAQMADAFHRKSSGWVPDPSAK
jgi:hypothetical protein